MPAGGMGGSYVDGPVPSTSVSKPTDKSTVNATFVPATTAESPHGPNGTTTSPAGEVLFLPVNGVPAPYTNGPAAYPTEDDLSSEMDPLLPLRPPVRVELADQPTGPCVEEEALSGQPAGAAPQRPEYHLLPHSMTDNSLYWSEVHEERTLPVEALFEAASEASQPSQPSRTASTESLPEQLEIGRPARRYRRMVSYSRTGLAPLYGSTSERSSSIPVHLDQISQDPSAGGYTALQKKLLFGIGLGDLLTGCSIAVLIPFFPTDAQARGVSDTIIGFVFSSHALTQLIMTPIASKLIPKFGMSQVLYFGLLLTGLSTVGFGALDFVANDSLFIALCLVVRVISAVGEALYVTASLTVVANQFPANVNMAMGVVETCNAIGISVGPAIGGVLYQLGGYGLPFYVTGGFILLCAALNFCLTPWIERDTGSRPDFYRMTRVLVRSSEVWLCIFAIITISVDWSAMEPGIQPYATKTLGITVLQMGLYFLVASGAYALVSPLWGKLADISTNSYIQISLCLAGSTISLLVLAPLPLLAPLAPSWWLLGLAMTLNDVFTAGAYIPLFGIMLSSAVARGLPDDVATQSFVSGLWWAVFSMGRVVGPAFSGAVTQAYHFPVTMACVSVITLCCALLMIVQACRLGSPCCAAIHRKLTGGRLDPERRPLLDERERRASV